MLDISWNRVEVIPNGIGSGLSNLVTLNASNNIVHFLPADMSGLTSLESFDMTYNELISLPGRYEKELLFVFCGDIRMKKFPFM
jgi:Leucine-rich repeat (LRR) protein